MAINYNYDSTYCLEEMNRSTQASCSGCSQHNETFTYDGDGNIITITGRKDWLFNPVGGTNRLDDILDFNNNPVYTFQYDAKGNVTSKIDNQWYSNSLWFTYDHRNLPILIQNPDQESFIYRYDENGMRVFKQGQGTYEYYLRDHTGREVAIYDYDTNRIKQINLFGHGLTGTVKVDWSWQWVPAWCHPDGGYWELTRSDNKYYYIKDHLGNIRVTLAQDGTVASARDYYPYGETLRATTTGGVVDRYQFTEKERDAETNLDYFGARYYNSGIMRWMTPDPLADMYHGWSPYNYVLGNPLRFVDPDGKDVWEIDSAGAVVNRVTDETQDAFYILDADGNRIEGQSITFEYGTITSTKGDTEIFNPFRRRGDKMTLFYVKGEDNAKKLFEFFADPKSTNVEWSWANIYRGPGNSVVGTSHLQEMTRVGRYLRVNQYFVREYTHNHPGGDRYPSESDFDVAGRWYNYNSDIVLRVYTHQGNYVRYNQHRVIR